MEKQLHKDNILSRLGVRRFIWMVIITIHCMQQNNYEIQKVSVDITAIPKMMFLYVNNMFLKWEYW